MKQDCRLRVRIPEFVDAPDMSAAANGQPRALRIDGGYADLGELAGGTEVVVRHPLARRRVREMVN